MESSLPSRTLVYMHACSRVCMGACTYLPTYLPTYPAHMHACTHTTYANSAPSPPPSMPPHTKKTDHQPPPGVLNGGHGALAIQREEHRQREFNGPCVSWEIEPRTKSRRCTGLIHRQQGMTARTHLANGKGRCPPLCGPNTGGGGGGGCQGTISTGIISEGEIFATTRNPEACCYFLVGSGWKQTHPYPFRMPGTPLHMSAFKILTCI